jgi:CBS domain containing-hemolysin-like protein
MYQLLAGLLRPVETPAITGLLHGVSFVLSFLFISFLHVVVGEVVPKNIAIDKADRLAVIVAPVLLVFGRISTPFVYLIERSAEIISRALRVGTGEHRGGHSAEELKLIVTSSRGLGYLPEAQEDMIHRVIDFMHIMVREVMVPRNDIVSIREEATLDEVLRKLIDEKHSRLPVYEKTPEHIIGILHYKDLLPVWEERRRAVRMGRPSRPFQIRRLMRKHTVVPETKPLSQMLEEFKRGPSHMALVVDEFGTIVGALTVEDVLEQLVGKIEDEHDEPGERPLAASREVELDGATRIRDLESEFGIEIPDEAGFETLAGFLLYRLGSIPRPGESVEYEGRRYTVLEMDRNRIAKVKVERLPEQPVPATG